MANPILPWFFQFYRFYLRISLHTGLIITQPLAVVGIGLGVQENLRKVLNFYIPNGAKFHEFLNDKDFWQKDQILMYYTILIYYTYYIHIHIIILLYYTINTQEVKLGNS